MSLRSCRDAVSTTTSRYYCASQRESKVDSGQAKSPPETKTTCACESTVRKQAWNGARKIRTSSPSLLWLSRDEAFDVAAREPHCRLPMRLAFPADILRDTWRPSP